MVKKKTLINNSLSGISQLVITALLTFFCIPIFINKLGTELYGIFALISIIGNLNLFTNLGLDISLTKFIAEQGKCVESNKDILSSLGLTVLIILPISTLVYLFHQFILIEILSIPTQYYETAESLFISLLLANTILLIGQTFTAVLNGLHRIYLSNFIQLVYSIIYWLGIIVVVQLGLHLEAIGYIILGASLVWLTLNLSFFFFYWGKLNLKNSFHQIHLNAHKQMQYGIKIYGSGIISFFNEPLFKILISNCFGVSAVAYFEIALRIRGQVTGLFNKMMQPLFPYLSQMSDIHGISVLIKDLTKKIFLLVLPICVMLAVTCHDIVTLWLSRDISNYTLFIVGIVVPYLVFSPLTLPIYLYLIAKGHPGKTIVIQFTSVIVNIVSFYLLYHWIGFFVIILSNVLSYLSSFILGLYYQGKFLNIKYSISWTTYLKFAILMMAYVGIGCCIKFIPNELISIIISIILILIFTLILYKRLGIVYRKDITRYFSDNKYVVSLYNIL